MYITCPKCKQRRSVSKLEKDLLDKCQACRTPIADGEYEKNVFRGLTIFASTGENLGHRALSESVFRFYREQNPDEKIRILSPVATFNFAQNYSQHSGYNKLFWADVSNIALMPKGAIYYSLAREATALAKRGIYPVWNDKQSIDAINTDKPFVVLHLRNTKHIPTKNATEYEARAIISALIDFDNIILIGNDRPFECERIKQMFDFREKLSLENIAWLCGHENCIATIGKDSGPLHLAAASGGRVIGYGYQQKAWFPKGDRVKCFMKTDENFYSFLQKIKIFGTKEHI